MSPMTRRQLLALGAVGAGSVAVGGTGLWWTSRDKETLGGGRLVQPEVLASRDGVLDLALRLLPPECESGHGRRTCTHSTGPYQDPPCGCGAGTLSG